MTIAEAFRRGSFMSSLLERKRFSRLQKSQWPNVVQLCQKSPQNYSGCTLYSGFVDEVVDASNKNKLRRNKCCLPATLNNKAFYIR